MTKEDNSHNNNYKSLANNFLVFKRTNDIIVVPIDQGRVTQEVNLGIHLGLLFKVATSLYCIIFKMLYIRATQKTVKKLYF